MPNEALFDQFSIKSDTVNAKLGMLLRKKNLEALAEGNVLIRR